MNFFRSVFADDEPQPPSKPNTESSSSQDAESIHLEQQHSSPSDPATHHDQHRAELTAPSTPPSSDPGLSGGGWSIGGLVKTFATRSESVIETYRRDLKEFGSGLKKETESLREVANRAVKELPPIEINATKAQGAIDSIGSTLWKSTAEIIAQGKQSLLADEADSSNDSRAGENSSASNKELDYSRYSRFELQLRAIQGDVHTYTDEPESGEEYGKWRSEFDLGEKGDEMEGLMKENGAVVEMYTKVVPASVDHETFWCRYYYQVHRLVMADSARAKLVANSRDEEEELSWDIDDEEVEETSADELPKKLDNVGTKRDNSGKKDADTSVEDYAEDVGQRDLKGGEDQTVPQEEKREEVTQSSEDGDKKQENVRVQAIEKDKLADEDDAQTESASVSKKVVESNQDVSVVEPTKNEKAGDEEVAVQEDALEPKKDESTEKSIANAKSDANTPAEGSSQKDDGVSVAQKPLPSQQDEEEELGWDEIEDLGSDDNEDDKKLAPKRSSDREEIRKRLSIADDDDEDLSWDIEDDD